MSLLLLFQGGGGVDIPPAPPAPPESAHAFLSHGDVSVGPGASTEIGPETATTTITGGGSTTIQ